MKNLQTLWVGLSFLVVGLAVGLFVANGTDLLGANVMDAPEKAAAPEFDVDALEFVAVSVDDDAMLGDPNAPVTIVEFSDFQCPYCSKFVIETMPLIQENYIDTGLVNLVFRDYPLPSHADGAVAAEAAECVGEEGDDLYFAMHDAIFLNTELWSYSEDVEGALVSLAGELGVDISACLANGDMAQEVTDDLTAAREYGVSGTPTFFINGKKLVGAYPYEYFEMIIESEL